jgi:hypothetical protein
VAHCAPIREGADRAVDENAAEQEEGGNAREGEQGSAELLDYRHLAPFLAASVAA